MRSIKAFLATLLIATTMQAHAGTAFYTGESTSGMYKTCYYNYLGSSVAISVSAASLCPLTIRMWIMNSPMQATERNIPMKDAIESAEKNLAELHSRLLHLEERLRPVLTPPSMDTVAESCVDLKVAIHKEESPVVRDVRNIAAGINGGSKIIEDLLRRIEV